MITVPKFRAEAAITLAGTWSVTMTGMWSEAWFNALATSAGTAELLGSLMSPL